MGSFKIDLMATHCFIQHSTYDLLAEDSESLSLSLDSSDESLDEDDAEDDESELKPVGRPRSMDLVMRATSGRRTLK